MNPAKLAFALGVIGSLAAAPARAIPCPATPWNLPVGKARWSEKGDVKWRVVTSDKTSYTCQPPEEWEEKDKDGIYTNYRNTKLNCPPLVLTIKECIMDEGRSYYPRFGFGKDFYTALCEIGGRWKYSLVDKKGEEFKLVGLPEFSLLNPSRIAQECANTHSMTQYGIWVFLAGAKDVTLIRSQEMIAVSDRQPSL